MRFPTSRILMAAAAAVVLLVAAFYLAVYSPQTADLTKAKTAHAAALSQQATLQGQVASLETLIKYRNLDETELSELDAAIPDNPDLADVFTQLEKVSTATGVVMSSVNTGTPASSGTSSSTQTGPPAITVGFTITGTYPQTVNFINSLNQLARTFVIKTVSITPQLANGTITLTTSMTTQIFYADGSNSDEASSAVKVAGSATAATSPSTTSSAG